MSNQNQNIPAGCKPFDAEKALAGAKLRTREAAWKASELTLWDKDSPYPYSARIHFHDGTNQIYTFTAEGRQLIGTEQAADLFLVGEEAATPPAPEVVTESPTPSPELPAEPQAPSRNVPSGMLPFDLEKALGGAALVTRSGQAVTGFRIRLGSKGDETYPYEALLNGCAETFTVGGGFQFLVTGANDLFLAADGEPKSEATEPEPAAAPATTEQPELSPAIEWTPDAEFVAYARLEMAKAILGSAYAGVLSENDVIMRVRNISDGIFAR